MSIVPAPATTNNNEQATILKSIVLNPEWFDRNQTKFEDW